MNSDEYDLLRRYLLNRLGPEEREQVRLRLFSEPALFDLASEVENDLIDAYAVGKLSHDEAEGVAEIIAATGGEQRVEFARALARHAERNAATEARRVPSLPVWLAAAASVAFAVSGAILFIAAHRTEEASRIRSASSQPQSGTIAMFDVQPVLRGSGRGAQVFRVPPAAKVLNIRVPAEPGFARCEIAVRDAFGDAIWSQTSPDSDPLELLVPSSVLHAGRYEITVDGERAGAPPERIEDTDIEIARQ